MSGRYTITEQCTVTVLYVASSISNIISGHKTSDFTFTDDEQRLASSEETAQAWSAGLNCWTLT